MSGGREIRRERGGFVLALVVLMLFAISVAGAAGYLVVTSEASLASYSLQGGEALAVARAGLHRFVAEQIGVVGDSVSYAIGNGIAMVTTRKLTQVDSDTDMYYLRSEGTVADPFTLAFPARSVVGAYAYHQRRPLKHHAAFTMAADSAYAESPGALVSGVDFSNDPDCPGAGAPPVAPSITGAIARLQTGAKDTGVLDGSPLGETWAGGFAQIYDSIALRWDVLSDPGFPVTFDGGSPPNFAALPADSFPVVRVYGHFTPGSSWSGRGVLIVTDTLDSGSSFSWDGIILAGALDDIVQGDIRGMVVGGLNGPNPYGEVGWFDTIRYYSCFVDLANESLSYLELIDNSVFEAS